MRVKNRNNCGINANRLKENDGRSVAAKSAGDSKSPAD
jgi:hypothetical protein